MKSGRANSKVATFKFTQKLRTLAAPTASPKAGTFSKLEVQVTLSCAEGAAIYYTLDGKTTPTVENGILYEEPITLNKTTTIKAIAVMEGWNNSKAATFKFTQKLAAVAAPTITASKKTGLTDSGVDVTLSCKTAGAVIRYTLDSSDPKDSGTASEVVSGTTISVSAPTNGGKTVTLRAIAVAPSINPAPSKETKVTLTWKTVPNAAASSETGAEISETGPADVIDDPVDDPADVIDDPADIPEDVIDIPGND